MEGVRCSGEGKKMGSRPKVLVYGAGVLGCSIAHALCEAGQAEVSLLARGQWADSLERDGLCIRHVVQRRATCDRVHVVRELATGDAYDLVIVAVQAQQAPDALLALVRSRCEYIVFVGNDVDAAGLEARVHELAERPKECAFGFFSVGGRREGGEVMAAYVKLSLTVGGAKGPLSDGFVGLLRVTGLKFELQDQMDAWLKWHAACILPLAYLSYAHGCDLTRASGSELGLYLDACAELSRLFEARGIPIRPAGDEAFFLGGPRRVWARIFYGVVFKTPLGRLCVTDHCLHAVPEMRSLASGLEPILGLDKELGAAPAYQALKAAMPSWDELALDPRCGRG